MPDTTKPRHIKIFDTTLRDGEQSPGCSMNLAEKLEVAQALVDLGVDVIEAGFPDRLARRLRGGPRDRQHGPRRRRSAAWPAATTRTSTAPGKRCKHAERPRIHVFLATSAIHREFKLQDGQGGDRRAGGRRREAGQRLLRRRRVLARRRRPHRARLSLPGRRGGDRRRRDDGQHSRHGRLRHAGALRRASSRTLDEPRAEHRQGGDQRPLPQRPGPGRGQQPGRRRERRRADRMHDQRHRRAGRQLLARRSRDGAADAQRLLPRRRRGSTRRGSCRPAGCVVDITGMQVQRNKAIVGRNAFAHEAGIHQDGMLKERTHLRDHAAGGRRLRARPTWCWASTAAGRRWPTGPRRWAITSPASSCRPVFDEFKKLADKKKEIYDGDIAALIEQQIHGAPAKRSGSSSRSKSPAAAATSRGSSSRCAAATRSTREEVTDGDGPIDAAFLAIEKITGIKLKCSDFQVHSATLGHDAQGEVNLEGRARRPNLPRPRRLDRHRRSHRPGDPQRRQPHRPHAGFRRRREADGGRCGGTSDFGRAVTLPRCRERPLQRSAVGRASRRPMPLAWTKPGPGGPQQRERVTPPTRSQLAHRPSTRFNQRVGGNSATPNELPDRNPRRTFAANSKLQRDLCPCWSRRRRASALRDPLRTALGRVARAFFS